ncbi:MAG TPA: efflux RND transporter periplasmic adaptor subunit [Thermoanaerobaculia bacterium]|jgi:Cu(I)/Ag(I) efflux system membrane fusion protein|nr:efflux RND transporter periplasmic adaptor subunit [Thermoanaerobaculia bacterium]
MLNRNLFFSVAIALAGGAMFTGCHQAPGAATESLGKVPPKILYWVDPMHPAYTSDKPGKAPDCGMDLVPVYEKPAEKTAEKPSPPGAPAAATVELSPQAISAAGVATAQVKQAALYRVVRAEGVLGTDETRLVHIAARVAGRLDHLDLDFTGEPVRRGAPIYSIYSPDLVASGREYSLALENLARARAGGDAGYVESAESLAGAARERLALWGLDPAQIDRIASTPSTPTSTRHPEVDLVVHSPISGTVLEKKVVAGQYVTEGQDLYLLADLSRLWLSAKVYEQELGGIKVGQLAVARFPAFPGRDFEGRIRFIDPVLDPATRTAGVRIELPNPGGLLKPGMFAAAELRVDLGRGLAIPKSAVLDTGVRQVVYVRLSPTRFAGREVKLGPTAGDLVQVLGGLKEGEEVVTAANFLIDSQSQLAAGQSIQWGGASEVKKDGRPK